MGKVSLFDPISLEEQIALQKKNAWQMDDFNWAQAIDMSKDFLPLDEDNLFFPGASNEQSKALSQLFGLILNDTISEMECCLPRVKYIGWELFLNRFPVSPQLRELGELFFEEEEKHAKSFNRFKEIFIKSQGIDPEDLDLLLPKAFNSFFQDRIIANAKSGGHAFWWTVAAVEEVSIKTFRELHRNKDQIDPLFYELHKKHAEEENRHANYAFLMLELAKSEAKGIKGHLFLKKDLIFSQLISGPWIANELRKIFQVKKLAHKHPWFQVLSDSMPLFEKLNKKDLIKKFLVTAPYVSWLANPKYHQKNNNYAKKVGAPTLG